MRRILVMATAAAAATAGIAYAQTLADDMRALAEAKRQASAAERRAAGFEDRARRATTEALKARARGDAVLARIQAAEADIAAATSRIQLIERLRERQRDRLASMQQPVVRLTAALQTLARRPPVLALTEAGSIDDLVHVRAVLGTTLPVIAGRTEGLRRELAESERLRHEAELAAASLAAGRERLARERQDYARMEEGHLRASRAATDAAMRQQDVAMALGERARDIVDEMEDMQSESEVRRRLASLPAPMLRPRLPWEPPLPAQAPQPSYRLPVAGPLVSGFGEVSESGIRARGLTLAPAAGKPVLAPAPGRVAFAAPFRSYGSVVIIDHGGGYSSAVTGLGALSVRQGDRVASGDPIGQVPAGGRTRVSVELRHGRQPLDVARRIAG